MRKAVTNRRRVRKEKGCGLTVKRIALPARPPTLLTSGGVGSVSLRLLENIKYARAV